MIQLQMIDRVKSIALDNKLIASVLMYGSFIKDEGDQYSDIEGIWASGLLPKKTKPHSTNIADLRWKRNKCPYS